MIVVIVAVMLAVQTPGRDSSTFVRRAAEFEQITAQRGFAAAGNPDIHAAATLAWLRALQNVLKAIPIERADGPHLAWVKANADLIVYSEPAGEWLIRHDLLVV